MTKKTYLGWQDIKEKRKQIEHTEPTLLVDKSGKLLVQGGWARHNLFEYHRDWVEPQKRGKEWDFYQLSNGKYMVQISIANISIGGYVSTVLADVSGKTDRVITGMGVFLGGKNKYVLPENGDCPNLVEYTVGKHTLKFETREKSRTISFSGPAEGKMVEAKFDMDLFDDHQNITIVTPFKKRGKYMPTRFFMTMKQNCMPCEGIFRFGDEVFTFDKKDTFCVLDWGRGCWPYKNVWYWGNGAQRITDENGEEHIFGFEITWGIGDESNATETCLFYDGVAHKIGSVDVEVFPKPDKYMEPWHFISEDGRFDLTMTPTHDHHSDMNGLNIVRLHSHQVHGLWNGTVTLDDGKKLEIKDMYAFCEYVENKW